MKRSLFASLLVIAAACGIHIAPPVTTPVDNGPTPIETPAPQVAILTVFVDGPECGRSSVSVGQRTWATRQDCSIVEEFVAGEAVPVSASADGYLVSEQQIVAMRAGQMAPIRIALQRAPAPVTVPPDIETPVEEIPPAVWVTIRRFVAAYPFPMGDGSETYIATLRHWTRQLTEQLRFSHGPEWGHKATSPNAPPSKESIARLVNGDLHVWDMLTGAATGRPTLAGHPSHYHVNDQHFIEVPPVDHLVNAPTTAARPRIPQPWIGLTSFDLGVRLEAGDRRWVDMMVEEGFTVARIVVASVYRKPRTLADGLRQLPLTLSTLAGAGLRAEVVVLVDTRDYRMDRAAMRDYLRKVVAICDAQPAAVAGVEVCGGIEIANESTHGTQVEDLSDPGFLRELERLVPARFATSCGSSHGGEAPFVSACSYVTHHADRARTPEENAAIMAQAQQASGLLVVDDEALGIAEQARPGARTSDPAYGERQARAARQYGLGGVTLHLEAGLTTDVDKLGPVQREAIRRFVLAMRGQ